MHVRTDNRQLTVTITERYWFDTERVNTLFRQLGLSPFADYDDDARAQEVFEAIYDSPLFHEVFYGGEPDSGYEYERFDPDA